jgi:hypothetical protein
MKAEGQRRASLSVAITVAMLLAFGGCNMVPRTPKTPLRPIACALGGKTTFANDCGVEQLVQGDARYLIVQHPDGGFRRFRQVDDGRGVVAADGVEEASAKWAQDGTLEVAVGQDRYRFPARMRPDNAAKP